MNKRQVKKIILGLGWLGLFLSVFSSSALAVDSQTTLYFGSHEKVLDESGGSLPAGRQVIEEKTYLSLPHVMVMKKGGEVFYLHQDHLSSTRLITDESGQIVEEYDYYPYGSLVSSDAMPSHLGGVEVVASPPTRSDYLPGVTSLFPGVSDKLYTSQTLDDSTNLYYYRARYYNPTTAHFLSADSAEGPNRYAYVAGNPISRNDPSGRQSSPIPIEKKPWFIEQELIPEAKELYGVTFQAGDSQQFIRERGSQWSAEEIFALEDLFQRIDPYMYKGRTLNHYSSVGKWAGGFGELSGSKMWLISSPKTLSSSDYISQYTTEWAFLHEATHNIATDARYRNFLEAVAKEGITWDVAENLEQYQSGESIEMAKSEFIKRGYQQNSWGEMVRTTGNFPTDYASIHPREGFAEFGYLFYGRSDYMKENYPELYDFFENLENSNFNVNFPLVMN